MTKSIEITAAQARLIQEAHKAAALAQGQVDLVLRVVLAGHDAEGKQVVSLGMDRDPPVLVVRDPGEEAAEAVGAEQSTNENARAAALR